MNYSKLVFILKIILPLVALGLLASLFLLSRNKTMDNAIPFAKTELDARIREQRISQPFYSGTNAAGDDIYLSAQKVVPKADGSDQSQLTGLDAQLTTQLATEYRIKSPTGSFDHALNILGLSGGVAITSTQGYAINTDELIISGGGMSIETTGAITGQGPNTAIEAGKMVISRPSATEPLQIRFSQGIKVTIDPKE